MRIQHFQLAQSGLPMDFPTDIPTDLPIDIPTDLPTDLPIDIPTDLSTDIPTDLISQIEPFRKSAFISVGRSVGKPTKSQIMSGLYYCYAIYCTITYHALLCSVLFCSVLFLMVILTFFDTKLVLRGICCQCVLGFAS